MMSDSVLEFGLALPGIGNEVLLVVVTVRSPGLEEDDSSKRKKSRRRKPAANESGLP